MALLLTLVALAVVWLTAVTVVIGLCISVARGERECAGAHTRTASRRGDLRLIA